MKVNFASGIHPFPAPWVNVDLNQHPDVHERVDLLEDWPPSIADVELAYVGHFLEHITQAECGAFLRRLRSVMRDGGRVVVVGPDVAVAEYMYAEGQISQELLVSILPHGERYGNDVSHIHAWGPTVDNMERLLECAGFLDTQDITFDRVWRYGIPIITADEWQMAITARWSPGEHRI